VGIRCLCGAADVQLWTGIRPPKGTHTTSPYRTVTEFIVGTVLIRGIRSGQKCPSYLVPLLSALTWWCVALTWWCVAVPLLCAVLVPSAAGFRFHMVTACKLFRNFRLGLGITRHWHIRIAALSGTREVDHCNGLHGLSGFVRDKRPHALGQFEIALASG
jgi:hypothetical protein